jgi:alpha-L-fucosidase
MKNILFLLITMGLFLQCTSPKQTSMDTTQDYLQESTEAFDQRMEWWRDAGFGMFIHWGPYAVPAGIHKGESVKGIGEWIMHRGQIPVAEYEEYSRQFNPTQYDAREWVRIAKDAGMKYIVITSKHHDGFCLWDSKVTDYDVMDFAPIKRDLLAELKTACDEQDMILGFYHSIMDWHHPDAQAPHYPNYNTRDKENPNFPQYYTDYLKPQVRELVKNYDPAILWFDGEWIPEYTHEQGLEMYNFVRSLKPDIVINNRVDKGRKGMQGMNDDKMAYAGDFGTPEQEILEGTSDFLWESCMTMNDSWGYKSEDHNWKSTETLIHNIVDIAAKGGNYLLNVGPTAEGLIPEPSVERLAGIGKWMKVNGEIMYGSRAMENYQENDQLYYIASKDGATTYLVATEWPGESLSFQKVQLPTEAKVELLGYDELLNWKQGEDGLTTIEIPAALQEPANRPCEFAWVFKVQ